MKFTDLLQRRRIPYKQSNHNSAEIKLCCPFCPERRGESDTKFCLGVNVVTGAGHCFHADCNWASKRHAVVALLRWLKEPLEVDSWITPEDAHTELTALPKDFQPLWRPEDDLDRKAYAYLQKRGITRQQMKDKRIGVSYSGRYAYRIVFPVMDHNKLQGIVSRDFVGREPRYLNSPGIKTLYNLPSTPTDQIILSEGIIKALRLEQVTSAASVALLGHSLNDDQLDRLVATKCTQVTIFPDPDRVGRLGAIKIADTIVERFPIKVSIVWPVEYPADETQLWRLDEMLRHVIPFGYKARQDLLLGNSLNNT